MAEAFPGLTTAPVTNNFNPSRAVSIVEPDAGTDQFIGCALMDDELDRSANERRDWIWQGYLAAGKITTLTSLWKSGKTTLISILFAQMGQGGQLATLPVAKGRAAIISEEGPEDWGERRKRLRICNHVTYFCRPFKEKPTHEQWLTMLKSMRLLQRQRGLDLVVIDTLTTFLPGDNENTAGVMMKYLMPLRALTDDGLAVLLVHHPRKSASMPGLTARGSGALPSHADINLEMSWVGRPDQENRRRWLRAFSRARESRRSVILELLADGSNYALYEPEESGESAECWQVVEMILGDAWTRMSQREILEEWPEDFAKPEFSTLSRCLHRAQALGQVLRRGAGKKNEPYQFWLPGKEEDMRPDEGASKEKGQRWNNRWARQLFQGKGMSALAPPALEERKESERADPAPTGAEPTTDPKVVEATTPNNEPSAEQSASPPDDLPAEPETQQPAAPAPVATEPPRMPESPTEYVPVDTAPLPPGIHCPTPPQPDPKLIEAERIRLRCWPR